MNLDQIYVNREIVKTGHTDEPKSLKPLQITTAIVRYKPIRWQAPEDKIFKTE